MRFHRSALPKVAIARPGWVRNHVATLIAGASLGPIAASADAQVTGPRPVSGPRPADIVECPGLDYNVETGLAGKVKETGGEVTIPNAHVFVSWDDPGGGRNTKRMDADSGGVYIICGLPVDTDLNVTASFADYVSETTTLQVQAGPPAGWDIEVTVGAVGRRGGLLPGRIVGVVRDRSTERPIESAHLELMGEDDARISDGNGRFGFQDLIPGVYRVAVNHFAYDRMEQLVEVPENRTVSIDFNLSADPIELEPLVITAVRDLRLETRGFYERQEIGEKVGNGVFMDEEDVARLMPSRVTNLLQWIPGIRVNCAGGTRNCQIMMTRGQPSFSNMTGDTGCTNSNVYVDGVPVIKDTSPTDESIDNFVHPSDIAGMEVYRTASEVPAEFSGSVGRCGAIVIWTRSGG